MTDGIDWTEVEFDQKVNAIERALYADMWLTKILSEVLAEVARQDATNGPVADALYAPRAEKDIILCAMYFREAMRLSMEDKP